jgi:acetyl-CoA carboxylase biotin carboxylase subunit
MISKLAAWGGTREEAIDRLRRALDEYAVGGIRTTLPFFRDIVRDDEFIQAKLDTGFISRFNERQKRVHPAGGVQASSLLKDIAVIAAALAYADGLNTHATNHHEPQSKWKMAGREVALANSLVRNAK